MKLQSLIAGVRLCKDLGFQHIMIEFDLELVVDWMHKNICLTWYLWDFWEMLEEELKGLSYTIKHLYKEGNKWLIF